MESLEASLEEARKRMIQFELLKQVPKCVLGSACVRACVCVCVVVFIVVAVVVVAAVVVVSHFYGSFSSDSIVIIIHCFYIALFSALQQTHCAYVACDSE